MPLRVAGGTALYTVVTRFNHMLTPIKEYLYFEPFLSRRSPASMPIQICGEIFLEAQAARRECAVPLVSYKIRLRERYPLLLSLLTLISERADSYLSSPFPITLILTSSNTISQGRSKPFGGRLSRSDEPPSIL